MKTELKNFNAACEKVKRIEEQIKNVYLPSYTIIISKAEQAKDLVELRSRLRKAISERITANETLQIALNCQKAEDNTQLGFLTLSKAS